MIKSLFDRIPEKLLRKLASDRGYVLRPGEGIEEVKNWLLSYYRKGIEEISGRGGSVIEMAAETVRKVQSVMGIPTEEPAAEAKRSPERTSDVFSTVTMARIYEKQGLFGEALSVYEKLHARDPENRQWIEAMERVKAELGEAEESGTVGGAGAAKGDSGDRLKPAAEAPAVGSNTVKGDHVTRREPLFLLDMEEPPAAYEKESMVLVAVGPTDLYACWEVTEGTLEGAAGLAGSKGEMVLRIYEVTISEEGVAEATTRDEGVADRIGEYFIHNVRPGGFYRTALGLRAGPNFHPLVHSALEATPQSAASELREEEWMEVDQKDLLWRSREASALVVKGTSRLSLREKALLRLHALGKIRGSRLSGIPEQRLEKLFGTIRDLKGGGKIEKAEISSPPWDKK